MLFVQLFRSLGSRVYYAMARLEWRAFWALILIHTLVTYIGFRLAEEAVAEDLITYIYFYATSVSTIGYGDYSPASDAGRLFAALVLYPGGLCIFTVLLAKITQTAAAIWRKKMDGFGDYSTLEGLTVIVGHHSKATHRIIDDLVAGGLPLDEIVLMATEKPPFDTSELMFVRCEDLVTAEDLKRAGVERAKSVLIYDETDDITLTAALAVSTLAPQAHLVAAMECEIKAGLLRAHTKVTPVVAQTAEVVASEVLDPGISAFFTVLGSASNDVTAYAINVDCPALTADLAYGAFRRLEMTFLGTKCAETGMPRLNLPGNTDLTGMPLYYISARRIEEPAFVRALKEEQAAQA